MAEEEAASAPVEHHHGGLSKGAQIIKSEHEARVGRRQARVAKDVAREAARAAKVAKLQAKLAKANAKLQKSQISTAKHAQDLEFAEQGVRRSWLTGRVIPVRQSRRSKAYLRSRPNTVPAGARGEE